MTEVEVVQSLRELGAAEPRKRGILFWTALSIITFLGFTIVLQRDFLISTIALTAVVLAHELGHFLAMRMLGFQNVNLYLIPFMGGLATGTKHAAPAWQIAIFLFAGPLPGLIFGALLWISLPREIEVISPDTLPLHTNFIYVSAMILVSLNAFNLLPFLPLDGGRIVRLLIDGARVRLTVIFSMISSIVIVSIAIANSSWIMLLFSVLYLCTLPSTVRLSRKTAELRPQLSGMASELSRISDEDGAVLLKAANDIISREYQFYSREPNEMNEHLLETAKALVYAPLRMWNFESIGYFCCDFFDGFLKRIGNLLNDLLCLADGLIGLAFLAKRVVAD